MRFAKRKRAVFFGALTVVVIIWCAWIVWPSTRLVELNEAIESFGEPLFVADLFATGPALPNSNALIKREAMIFRDIRAWDRHSMPQSGSLLVFSNDGFFRAHASEVVAGELPGGTYAYGNRVEIRYGEVTNDGRIRMSSDSTYFVELYR